MKKLFVLAAVLMVIVSCKKGDSNSCSTSTASVSGSYKITACTYKATASSPEIDFYTFLFPDACDRDDVFTFNANGTYQLTDAGIVCSPSNNDNGTWSAAGNVMKMDGDSATIESFDCKKLVLVAADVLVAGDKLKITYTK